VKKFRKIGLAAGIILMLPFFVSAQSTSIAELQALIQRLQAQLNALQAQQSSQIQTNTSSGLTVAFPVDTCGIFTNILRIGSTGPDVARLQSILIKEGFNVSSSETVRYYYGESTASAVSGVQMKYRSEILVPSGLSFGTGIFGPSTMRKLNSLYPSCGVVVNPTPTPTSNIPHVSTYFPASPKEGDRVNIYGGNFVRGISRVTILRNPSGPTDEGVSRLTFHSSSHISFDAPLKTGSYTLLVEQTYTGEKSNTFTLNVLPRDPTTPLAPTVLIVASANTHASDGQINANVGEKLTISATVQNLPASYQRTFFFSPLFNGLCTNNTEWRMECVPNNTGVGTFYVEVYANGQTYRSNTVTVTVYPSNTPTPTPIPTPTSPLTITTPLSLPTGRVGENYSVTIRATGGSEDYKWGFDSGNVFSNLMQSHAMCFGSPCQLPLSFSGVINSAGNNRIIVSVTSGSQVDTKIFTLPATGETPPTNTPATAVVGYLDAASCDTIGGWALDQDNPSAQLEIEIWSKVDGSFWRKVATVVANEFRQDINSTYNVGNHAFGLYTPSLVKDVRIHQVYAYAKSALGPVMLTGSGIQVQCGGYGLNNQNQIMSQLSNTLQALKVLIGSWAR
jgi:peptidoglycan hydrolase-like protein with peptidoglycan-binding domain